MKRASRLCLAALFVMGFLALSGPAWCQTTASLRGTVTDQLGGVMAGANVTLRNTGTGLERKTTTHADGSYLFDLLEEGTYQITVEHSGFKRFLQSGIVLELNQNGRLDVSMKLGETSETIEVKANVAQVDTTGAVLGKVEDSRRLADLPILEREQGTLSLGLLQAGVFQPDQDDGSHNPFSVSGQRSESLTFLLDGGDNTDFLSNRIVQNPISDAVQEFRILTNNYDAQYGRTSGGIVNQIIKSGSNTFHGDLFEYWRNDVLNARDFFLPQKAPFKRNLFGGSGGGPIKKDKTFIFGAYQGSRRREGITVPAIQVLSPAERTGNFGELCPAGFDSSGNCLNTTTGTQLVNPASPACGSAGTTCPNYPFNKVPVNPIIKTYINDFLPLPNLPGNNFISSPESKIRDDQFVIRLDHNLTSRDSLSFVYNFEDQNQLLPLVISHGASVGGNVPAGSAVSDLARRQVGSLLWTHTFSGGMINQFRFGANRRAELQAKPVDTTPPSALGFKNVNPDDPKGAAPPIMFSLTFNLGPSPQGPTTLHDATFQWTDDVTMVRGKHEWKFGADVRRARNNFVFDFYNNGSFTFFTGFTGDPSAFADFVGGFSDSFFQFSKAIYAIRESSYYGYAQDTWKILPHLTLNLGVRYEYNTPQTDPHHEIMGFFPGRQSVVFPNAPPDILYVGDPNTGSAGLVFPDRNNWAPRVGFAWDMFGNAKLVMRGGGGIFYDIEDGALNLQFGGQPPFGDAASTAPGFSNFANRIDPIANPFGSVGIVNPFPFKGPVGTFFIPKMSFAYLTFPHFRTPYSENYNFGFQYQLTKDTMIEAVYVGSLGRKLITTAEPNFPQPSIEKQQLAQFGSVKPECARPLSACTIDGNLPSAADPVTINPNGFPTGAQGLLYDLSNGLSDSHELQLTIEKRFSQGFTVRTAYTLAKTIDTLSGFRARSGQFTNPLNYRQDRALADFDTPQRLVFSGLWELPWDKPFKSSGGFLRRLMEGWEIAGIAEFQAGNPFTLFSNTDSGLQHQVQTAGVKLERPDIHGSVTKFDPRKVQTFSSNCLGTSTPVTGNYLVNPAVFDCVNVPLFTFGTLGRNAIRGPGIDNFDLSLIKRTSITERMKLEFRAEFFNAFNHAQFFGPETISGAAGKTGTFGQITSARDPRLGQLGLRFLF